MRVNRSTRASTAGWRRWSTIWSSPTRTTQAARALQADALEQLGYQAESGPWRNFYLSAAKELRDGVIDLGAPKTASPM
jgi:alkyl sulfatase BDS1-like metallo-beta-lactamase superfamily hydrolase